MRGDGPPNRGWMKRKILFPFFIMILVCLIAAGCSESTPRYPWVTKWVQNPTCQPPCWENITPGVTKISDVPDMLRKIPEVTEIRGPEKRSSGEQCVDWNMTGFDKKTVGLTCAKKEKNDLVFFNYLMFDFNPGARITLQEIILAFGTPTFVLPKIEQTGWCSAIIFFMDKGFYVDTGGSAPGGKKMSITSDWYVDRVELFSQSSDLETTVKELAFDWPFVKNNMKNWDGYTDYPCR